LIGCASLYLGQEHILFRPQKISEHTKFRFGQEIEIPVSKDIDLHGLYHQEQGAQGAILYLHGNRGNARWCQRQAEVFAGYDHDVLLIDYRGYGKSDGEIDSGSQLYQDVQKAYDFLKSKYDESNIIVAGYSLGTGMASYLAAHNRPGHLMMIAPYVSIIDMKNRYLPLIPNFLIKYPLNNKKHLGQVHCPVAIFHGTEDEVIPFDSSEKLKLLYPDKVKLVTLKSTGHRGAIFHGAIRRHLEEAI